MTQDIAQINPKENIIIKGAKLHNLKNIDAVIPRNKLVVITGLSGSGKSSLAFDTLYAEGQRRYVESLSSYARQFLGRLDKPKVDYIKGIAPAIAIEQKVNSTNPRSTVGTSTEIYDYLKLLYARIGKTFSPISGDEVKKDTVTDVVNYIKDFPEREKLLLLAPILVEKGRSLEEKVKVLLQQGYSRIKIKDEVSRIDEANLKNVKPKDTFLVVDRIIKKDDEDFYNRLADSIQAAFYEGKGELFIENLSDHKIRHFSNKFELDGMTFNEPNVHLFSFNNPYGACPKCEGYGDVIGLDEDLIVPNTSLSIYEEAIFPWRGESMSWYKNQLVNNSHKFDFPIHKPYYDLTDAQKQLLWDGNRYFTGLTEFFEELEAKAYKIQNRVMLSRYRGKTKCPVCKGKRLREEVNYVKIGGAPITDLVEKPLDKVAVFFKELELSEHDQHIAKRLLKEINNRLAFLSNVGLDYLTLSRESGTLSGGEAQRIRLASQIGSGLTGVLYVLDEPSIGLHQKDNIKLINALKRLRDLGNTVIVVEHDTETIESADHIIDLGPEAGNEGGQIVAQGSYSDILKSNDSITGKYLSYKKFIQIPKTRRLAKNGRFLEVNGASGNNLNNVNLKIPLGTFTCVTGVSGSGKSTLILQTLYNALNLTLNNNKSRKIPKPFKGFKGTELIDKVIDIDQSPIGRTPRSNPATYTGAFGPIRDWFTGLPESKSRGYKPGRFSFNVKGGRCEACEGDGVITYEMHFLPDVYIQCDECKGSRYNRETLEIKFKDKSIADILNMTVDEGCKYFENISNIKTKLLTLKKVGLGYIKIGQQATTLSGGEAQRIKLAKELSKRSTGRTIYILDEPTTGLHQHDIKKLLDILHTFVALGNTVIVIEHNLDVIKTADYIVDMGPEGGIKGGNIIAEGKPEEICKLKESYTGSFLKEMLDNKFKKIA